MKKSVKKTSTVLKKNVLMVSPGHDQAGIAGGLLFAIIFFLVTLSGRLFGSFGEVLNVLLGIYGNLGYDVTYFGIIIGTVYGFITGFVLFYLYSWLHKSVGLRR